MFQDASSKYGDLDVNKETLTYQADGLTMKSQLFFEPAASPLPGVLVFPEAFGLSEHALSRAERLAAMGYVALACDLHGDGGLVDDLEKAIGLLQPLFADPSRTRPRCRRVTGADRPLRGGYRTPCRDRFLLRRHHGA